VIAAVALGILVGFVAPDFAVKLKPLGTGFVALIPMMIAPIIFCTLVLGIGSVRKASQVGRVGTLAWSTSWPCRPSLLPSACWWATCCTLDRVSTSRRS